MTHKINLHSIRYLIRPIIILIKQELIKEKAQSSLDKFKPAVIKSKVSPNTNSLPQSIKNDLESTKIDLNTMSTYLDIYEVDYAEADVKATRQLTLRRHSDSYLQTIALDMEPRERKSQPVGEYDYEKYFKNKVRPGEPFVFGLGNLETLIVLSTAVLFTFCLSLNAPTSTYPAIAAIQIVIYDFFKH